MDISIIKTVLGSIKLIKELLPKKEEKNNNSEIESKLALLERELKIVKKESDIKEKTGFNKVQIRLKTLFNSHGIEDNLITAFIKSTIDKEFEIPISEVSNLNYIFDRLTDNHINDLSFIFGINKGWIYSTEDMYQNRNYYKNIHSLIKFILEKSKSEKLQGFALRVEKFNNIEKEKHQPLYLLIRAPIITLFNKTVYRYYPINTDWKWNYWRTRYQAKSIFNLFETQNRLIDFEGKTVSNEELYLIASLNHCPDEIIKSKVQNTWYPYDYATSLDKNVNALELEEIDSILNYINEQGYKKQLENAEINQVKSITQTDNNITIRINEKLGFKTID